MNTSYINSLLILLLIGALTISCTTEKQNQDNQQTATTSNQGQAAVVDNESKANILQIAKNSPDHETLAAAIEAAGVQNVLVNAGPLTVFAPNDAAFDKLPEGTVEDLLKPENKKKLADIIKSHASPASLKKEQLTEDRQVYMATGHYVDIEKKDGETYVNGAKVLASIDASNGWIHVVDKVFLIAK